MPLKELEQIGQKILDGISVEEIDHKMVDHIWDLEPKLLTKAHRAVIIRHLRENRSKYETKKRQASEKKQRKKADPKPKPTTPSSEITLEDLDL